MDELEEWRTVVGLEARYAVSDQGRLWSLRDNKLLRPEFNQAKGKTTGYWRVTLWGGREIGKRHCCVHTLVLLAFIGPRPSNKHESAHNNGNSHDNRLTNLRWATRKENRLDRYIHGTAYGNFVRRGKVTADTVLAVTRAVRSGMSVREATVQFGLSNSYVRELVSGEKWPHIDRSAIPEIPEREIPF